MTARFIDSFIANMKYKGFAKANRYLVLIEPNPYVASKLGFNASTIKMSMNLLLDPKKSYNSLLFIQ